MDKETKTYLEEKFNSLATKDDVLAVEMRIASTLSDVVTLIDKRFDEVNERLETIEEKLDPTINQMSAHDKRISFLEDKVLS